MPTKGICHLSHIPLRGEPRSGAEMVTQLLYGESYTVLKEENEWFLIEMDYDRYQGWISDSSLNVVDSLADSYVQVSAMESFFDQGLNAVVHTSMGSHIPLKNVQEAYPQIGAIARQFLGSPYLWGGRHISGIDCSGFMQVIYKSIGVNLPRDASQQQKVGKPVAFANLFEGDLVFFHKNERIGHVGLALTNGNIIHSHGHVRIDRLTKEGILHSKTGELTHHFHSAKRLR